MGGASCRLAVALLCYVILSTSATVFLKPFSISFPDLPAKFAVGVNNSGICGALYVADPLDACFPLQHDAGSSITEQQVRFALIVRGGCSFENKIRNAQIAGFHAAIVYDDRDKGNLLYMMVNPEGIAVHAVFVSKAAGELLREHAGGEDGECCIYPPHNGSAWTVLAISFFSLFVMFGFLVIAYLAPRHWSYWPGRNHYSKSVDTKVVEILPRFTFSSAHSSHCHTGETCAICLEDYKDGEIVTLLPCHHGKEDQKKLLLSGIDQENRFQHQTTPSLILWTNPDCEIETYCVTQDSYE